jgi:hypothetical protein
MAIIIMSKQDDGSWVPATDLAERILEATPDTTIRMVKGNVSGVEVDDAAAVRYLATLYTAKGNARAKGGSDG